MYYIVKILFGKFYKSEFTLICVYLILKNGVGSKQAWEKLTSLILAPTVSSKLIKFSLPPFPYAPLRLPPFGFQA
jgi:hypothetical protein